MRNNLRIDVPERFPSGRKQRRFEKEEASGRADGVLMRHFPGTDRKLRRARADKLSLAGPIAQGEMLLRVSINRLSYSDAGSRDQSDPQQWALF